MIKKAYYSYWHGGYQGQPSEYIMDLNKISLHLARKNFDEIHFITDSVSKDYFKDLKFDSVSTELDSLDTSYGDVWSLGKIYAYQIAAERGDPFVHVDYDVFFWKKLTKEFLSKNLIAQWVEEYSYNIYQIPKLIANCPNLYLIKDIQPVGAINVGLFGGNDLDFIKNYAKGAISFIMDPANEFFWKRRDLYDNGWIKAVVAEQYYLEVSRIYYNKKIDVLFEKEWPREPEAKERGFSHLMGAKYKKGIREKVRKLSLKIEQKEKREEENKKLDEKSEKIIKIFGLPKSGTNLIQLLLSINIKNYVCQFSDHPNTHYLGWKHGLPKNIKIYNILQESLNQKVYFIFMMRDFESWKNSIKTRHNNSYEFPSRFFLEKGILYNTPHGPEYYDGLEELYNTYNQKYKEFAEQYQDRCLIVKIEDLQKDQIAVVNLIKDKFNFQLTNSSVCEIKKHLDSAGNINRLI
jgi:hypothetical protein